MPINELSMAFLITFTYMKDLQNKTTLCHLLIIKIIFNMIKINNKKIQYSYDVSLKKKIFQ